MSSAAFSVYGVRTLKVPVVALPSATGASMNCPWARIDATVTQPVKIFLKLDLFGNDAELHSACELDHCNDHLLVHLIRNEIARVGAVDLEIVDRQVFEVRKRTKAAAKIIQRKFTTDAVQDLDKALRMLHVRQNCCFRYLETYARWCDSRTIKSIHYIAEE